MVRSLALSLTTLGENRKAINLICNILDCPPPMFYTQPYRSDQAKLLSRLIFSEIPDRIRRNPGLLGSDYCVNLISPISSDISLPYVIGIFHLAMLISSILLLSSPVILETNITGILLKFFYYTIL